MNKIKNMFLFICIIVVFVVFDTNVIAAEQKDVTWRYENESATLIIEGTGETSSYYYEGYEPQEGDYESLRTPWGDYRDKVKTIIIGDGITGIGKYNFDDFSVLEKIVIPKSVVKIEDHTFPRDKNFIIHGYLETVAHNILNEYPKAGFDPLDENSGYCDLTETKYGHRVFWKYNQSEKKMIICGTGIIEDYLFEGMDEEPLLTPWSEYHDEMEKIQINEGITTIGQNAFAHCVALKEVKMADSIVQIHKNSFPSIELNQSFKVIGKSLSAIEAYATESGLKFEPANEQLRGDINANGEYEAEDALSILKMIVKLETTYGYSGDTNADGEVTAEDALKVLRKAVGLE